MNNAVIPELTVPFMKLHFLPQVLRCASPAILAALLLSCAGQVPPGGGPIDTTPPTIIRTIPDSNAVRVSADAVELEFDKYVDRRSVEESIFISPYVGELEFAWSGRTVVAKFSQPLRTNTTYVVNVGTDVKDVRAGNRMAHGFTLAFTTGDSIDVGAITGKVYDPKPEGVMLFAYALNRMNPDTLDPTHTRPDYIMQTGKDGSFELTHLAWGAYRVIAVRDEYRNLVYDRQVDAYGVWRGDVVLAADHPAAVDLGYRLTTEDTTKPFVSAARELNRRTITVRFSEPIDSTSFSAGTMSVLDTVSRLPVQVATWYLHYEQPTEAGVVTAAPLDSGRVYSVIATGFSDRAGNKVDSTHMAANVVATASRDTSRPALRTSVTDSLRDVRVDAPILMSVTEPVLRNTLIHGIALLDSTRRVAPADIRWRGGLDLVLVPQEELRPLAWYTLRIQLDSLRDLEGNGYTDSVRLIRFRTQDLRATGTIDGTVRSATNVRGPFRVTAARIGTSAESKTVSVARAGNFAIDRLPEGFYTLQAFQDADGSGAYRYGLPHPFVPSAQFGVYPDTVKVRARWGVQGVGMTVQ